MTMTILTREQILAADDLPTRTLSVPEWGGDITLRPMTASERDRFEMLVTESKRLGKPMQFRASLAAMCIVDEDGNRLFTDQEIEMLGNRSAAALDRVADVVIAMNRIGQGA